MRLGTCIALELAVAAAALVGLWIGVQHAADLAGPYFHAREAAAATSASRPIHSEPAIAAPLALPASHLPVAPPPIHNVFGAPDGELLATIGTTKVARLKLNHGGTSLSLRLDFASGGRAAFKPEQTHTQSDPRREIAAYRIDRLLGLGHVPPAKPAAFRIEELLEAAEPRHRRFIGERLAEEAIARDGVLHGEVSWWVPDIKLAKLGPFNVDERDGMEVWATYLQPGERIPPALEPMVQQLSAIILFDVLIDNPDRWTGSNTMASPDNKVLYFMDNTLSFSLFELGHDQNLGALRKIAVFPKKLVERLRALTYETVVAAIELSDDGGLGALLSPEQIRAMLARRDYIIRYIEGCIAQHGEDAVLGFP
ncbi:MAG: hypothetical protein AB7O24_03060 [Kofleriaceae bacterium]